MGRWKLRNKDKTLMSNTIMLYIMTFSTQILNLITVPYLTRVLGPTIYGKVGLAVACMTYIQLTLDFGFILSATQKIAEKREDIRSLSKTVTAVTAIKACISTLCVIVFVIFCGCSSLDRENANFYFIYLLAYIANSFMPDFFYRGIENMKTITFRTVLIKALFALQVFIFVKSEADYLCVPAFLLIGNFIAILISYIDIIKNYDIKPVKLTVKEALDYLKDASPFFLSRFASSVYQATNVVLLGWIYGISPVVGYYSSADKVISTVKSGTSPVADSLYPYMVKNRNFKLIKRMFKFYMPLITIGVIIVWIFAKPICILLFGGKYEEASILLRLLLPIAWVVFPSYILAFPMLTPMGLSKYANISTIFGTFVQITLIFMFWLIGVLDVYSICVATSITEVSIFLFRLIIVLNNRDILTTKKIINEALN